MNYVNYLYNLKCIHSLNFLQRENVLIYDINVTVLSRMMIFHVFYATNNWFLIPFHDKFHNYIV